MKKRYQCIVLLFLVSIFLFSSIKNVMADQVIIDNGDSISGTVEKIVGGKLTLKTDYSGPIDIDVSKIKKISTSAPVEVHMQSGEVLKGQLKATEDDKIVVESIDGRESTTIDWKKVASINPPPYKWTGSITAGANDQTGNTHRYGANIAFDAVRKTDIDRFALGYQFNYAHENQALTTRNHYGYMKYDYFFTKKVYGYLGTELLSDTFRDLLLRVAVGPGAGYQIWDDKMKFLFLEAGLSYVNETRIVGKNEDFLSVRIGGNFRYNIANFLIFSDKAVLYPRLDHVGRYIFHNEAGLAAPVSPAWSFKFANILDHDSNPPANKAENDLMWILGLQYSF